MVGKTRKNRKGPSESATEFPEGTIHRGLDKQDWVVKKTASGVHRWIPSLSAELFGYKRLTVDHLSKNIGKKIPIYEREYCTTWPPGGVCPLLRIKFTPTGDAQLLDATKPYENWLKTRTPPIKNNTMFMINGDPDGYFDKLQVDSVNKTLVSSRVMNTEAFVKVS